MKLRWFALLAVGGVAAFVAGQDGPEQIAGAPYHHTDAGFRNPVGSPARGGWSGRLAWISGKIVEMASEAQAAPAADHVLAKDQVLAGLAATSGRNTVTWIGHMTALLRVDGKTILTDPWLSDYATPIPPVGPKRYVPPALEIDELPKIDFVVISHSHYDHLDLKTIEALPGKETITAIVPLKLGRYFRDAGYSRVIELDWEDEAIVAGMRFTALPVIHWSKRGFLDDNETLWAGFAIEGPSGARIYFGGDAEYGPVYAQTAKRHGGFDLALLSIGAFLPRTVMNGAHCVPENCLKIGVDLGAYVNLGLHWGTIQLGDDGPVEGQARFLAGAKKLGLPDRRVWLMKIGETRVLPRRPTIRMVER